LRELRGETTGHVWCDLYREVEMYRMICITAVDIWDDLYNGSENVRDDLYNGSGYIYWMIWMYIRDDLYNGSGYIYTG